MGESVGKVFGILIFVIFTVLTPLVLILQNVDKTTTKYADLCVESFKNRCIETGEITDVSYTDFIERLSSTGYAYTVTIEHFSSDYNYSASKPIHTFEVTSNSDLVKALIKSNDAYKMQKGDYIKITAKSQQETTGTKIASLLTFGALRGQYIVSVDAGRITATH